MNRIRVAFLRGLVALSVGVIWIRLGFTVGWGSVSEGGRGASETSANPRRESNSSALLLSEPVSGTVVTAATKVWFAGEETRTDLYDRGELLYTHCTSRTSFWTAFPKLQRVFTACISPRTNLTFLETSRFIFSRTTNHARAGDLLYLGLPCWRFEWDRTNRAPAGVTVPATFKAPVTRESHLFLANPRFPLRMREGYSGVWVPGSDVLEVSASPSIPRDLFLPPTGFKVTQKFSAPHGPFEIVLRQSRSSVEHHWSWVTTNRLTSDGNSITQATVHSGTNAAGRTSSGSSERRFDWDSGVALLNPMNVQPFGHERRVGEETVRGFQTEVWAWSVSQLSYREWVTDHPVLGLIAVRRTTKTGDEPAVTDEVVSIRLE